MGRLFWKFFLAFWLSQLVTMIGIGIAVDLKHRADGNTRLEHYAEHPPRENMPPPHPEDKRDGAIPPPPPGESRLANTQLPPRPQAFAPPHRFFFIPWEPLVAGLIVSFIFAATLAWLFSRPIRSLLEGFATLAEGKLDTRMGHVLGKRNDEFGDLGRAFDGMASKLGGLMAAQKRLLHDVSHELRSPLARLQAATGLARQQPENLEVSMSRIEREAQRMDRLIDELLTLSRLGVDAQQVAQFEEINFGELLEGIVEDARFETTKAELSIKLEGNFAPQLRCQPALLHRAVENLVRNAIKFSPAHSLVRLVVEQPESGHFALRIEDEGPGIPPEDLESVFEPFVRGRTSHTITGYGLGLAIARSVIQAHGGTLEASNRMQGGLCVRAQLPTSLIVQAKHTS
ncbi:HAMP domain-containing sensor histidine kinase [Uliginosibacterium gangwonense]|uniref:HAMP domain-containing sensor histidine kinase n=1 Tax=Uliginosibacterium gangwonense TaxID=392736 RepID=UPI0003761F9E|nr:ATP-binding protein [Uliginosibacterium gangwonense]